MIRPFGVCVLVAAMWPAAASGQAPLTLNDAIARARAQNPAAGSAAAAEREASHRVGQARAGLLPRVDLTESWQRGNQPVFVFSSLLAQRRFSDADFALPSLNRPSPLDNFQATIVAEQSIFDGRTRPGVTAARIGQQIAGTRRQVVERDLAVGVTAAYGRVLMAVAAGESAKAAADAAQADRELAGNRRDAGLVTDADVLQLDVFVARRREGLIRAAADERTARAELNALMGEALATRFVLQRGVPAAAIETGNVAALEAEADANRAEVKSAALEERLAGANLATARAAFLPQVSARAGWEFNGGAWNARASSWVVGIVARLNLFQGFANQARLAEAREQVTRLGLERQQAQTAARLDVHLATARLDAARASEAVGRAAVAQARESRRIIRDRYEAGLTDVASLLRATEALVQAETQQTAAEVAVLIETAALERALGR